MAAGDIVTGLEGDVVVSSEERLKLAWLEINLEMIGNVVPGSTGVQVNGSLPLERSRKSWWVAFTHRVSGLTRPSEDLLTLEFVEE